MSSHEKRANKSEVVGPVLVRAGSPNVRHRDSAGDNDRQKHLRSIGSENFDTIRYDSNQKSQQNIDYDFKDDRSKSDANCQINEAVCNLPEYKYDTPPSTSEQNCSLGLDLKLDAKLIESNEK